MSVLRTIVALLLTATTAMASRPCACAMTATRHDVRALPACHVMPAAGSTSAATGHACCKAKATAANPPKTLISEGRSSSSQHGNCSCGHCGTAVSTVAIADSSQVASALVGLDADISHHVPAVAVEPPAVSSSAVNDPPVPPWIPHSLFALHCQLLN